MTAVTKAGEACGCGCCGPEKSREDEIAELHQLRESVNRRLSELETT